MPSVRASLAFKGTSVPFPLLMLSPLLISSPFGTQNLLWKGLLATGTGEISASQLIHSKGAFCWSGCNAVIFTFPSLHEGHLFSPNLFCEALYKGTKGFGPPVLSLREDVERNESWHYFL